MSVEIDRQSWKCNSFYNKMPLSEFHVLGDGTNNVNKLVRVLYVNKYVCLYLLICLQYLLQNITREATQSVKFTDNELGN